MVLAGCLWCVTIIGIPVGLQCFKFASLAFSLSEKEIIYGGWRVFLSGEPDLDRILGIEGDRLCHSWLSLVLTLLGIPIGKQCFKMAKLSLMPFGAAVI